MITIKTVEELENLCNEFLAVITERKNKAVEVRRREDSVFKRDDIYVLKYSKKKEYGFCRDLGLSNVTGKTIYRDSVDFWYTHDRKMAFWLNNKNYFVDLGNRLIIEFNGYSYSSVDISSDDYDYLNDHDYLVKRGIMIDLKLKLEELFK